MRKKLVMLVIACALFALPMTPVAARAGGATGGGHVSTGGTTSFGSSRSIGGPRMFFGRRRLLYGGPGALIAIGFVVWQIARYRRQTQASTEAKTGDVYPIDADLAPEFEQLFYAVETAWSDNNVDALYPLMTAKCYGKQRAILDRWQREGKTNRLDSLAIVDTSQEVSDADHPHVVVTAQARDYFQYANQPDTYNQQLKDDAMIQRFTEVWELAYAEDGHLLVDNIRQ